MAASSGSKMKLGMMKRKIKKKKVQTATGDRKWIKRMFFFVVARSPPATLRVRASSVRVLREGRGKEGFESLEILLRHRAFFCGVESFDRAWKITLPASHERGASPSISPRPHTSIDRSRFFAFSLSLSFSLLLFLSTNQRQRWLCLFSIRSPTSLERFPRFSTNRVERIGRVISFPFLFPFFLNKHVIYVWFSFMNLYGDVVSPRIFFIFSEIIRRHFWRIFYYYYYWKDERKNSRYILPFLSYLTYAVCFIIRSLIIVLSEKVDFLFFSSTTVTGLRDGLIKSSKIPISCSITNLFARNVIHLVLVQPKKKPRKARERGKTYFLKRKKNSGIFDSKLIFISPRPFVYLNDRAFFPPPSRRNFIFFHDRENVPIEDLSKTVPNPLPFNRWWERKDENDTRALNPEASSTSY